MSQYASSQFENFHRRNPAVYDLFKKFTFDLLDAGRKHYGSQSVIERIRWHTDVTTTDTAFKINNNHSPFYSRLFAKDFPQHKDFFRMRVSRKAA